MKAKKKGNALVTERAGMVEMLKKYKQGGKMTEGLKALFAEKPELKKKFGYAKHGMKNY